MEWTGSSGRAPFGPPCPSPRSAELRATGLPQGLKHHRALPCPSFCARTGRTDASLGSVRPQVWRVDVRPTTSPRTVRLGQYLVDLDSRSDFHDQGCSVASDQTHGPLARLLAPHGRRVAAQRPPACGKDCQIRSTWSKLRDYCRPARKREVPTSSGHGPPGVLPQPAPLIARTPCLNPFKTV